MLRPNMPLREGVPQWVGAVIVILIMVITCSANGICLGSAPEYVGVFDAISDDVNIGYYSTSVGLCLMLPLYHFLHARNTPKTILLVGLVLEVVLAFISAETDSVTILAWASFFTGITKGILILLCLDFIKPFITPKGNDYAFVAWIMPFCMGVGQLSTFITEWFTFYYSWQFIYYVIIVISLVAIILVLLFFKYANFAVRFPFRQVDFKAILLISVSLLGFVYFFSYGKTLDWFHSKRLVIIGSLTLLFFFTFLLQTNYSSKPYIRSWQLLRWQGLIGYGFMVLVMFFNASSSVISDYLSAVLKIDNLHSNLFNLKVIPGYIVGGYICYLWYRYKLGFRWLIVFAMSCYVAYFAIAYFNVSPQSKYESLEFALFLKGVGLIILFSAFIIYIIEDLKPQEKPSHLFYIICIRGVLAPVLWGGVVSTVLYNWTQNGINRLSDNIRLDNHSSYTEFMNSLNGAITGGHSNYEALQLSTSSLYGSISQQASLLAVKQFLGMFLIIALVAAVISVFIPYQGDPKKDLVKRPVT